LPQGQPDGESNQDSRRFTRLTNRFSKKLDNHVAAVWLYVAHYNLCRTHEAQRTAPAKALGLPSGLGYSFWMLRFPLPPCQLRPHRIGGANSR